MSVWVTVDTRANVETPHMVTTAFNGGVPYPLVPLATPAPDDLGSHFTLPLVVQDSTGSFKEWKVIVNGEVRPGHSITVRNQRLRVDSSGTAIFLR